MRERTGVALRELTTLRLGGPARRVVEVETEDELVEVVSELDAAAEPVLVLGGGSNVIAPDEGFDGTVVLIRTRGVRVESDAVSGAMVSVAAGEDWDRFVARAVDEGWTGVEALAGIPGLTGATPIQNVGAYGQDVAQTIASVRAWDREAGSRRTFANADCRFTYRHSRFKGNNRYVLLEVTFQLRLGELAEPVGYAELARALGVDLGDRPPAPDVRAAVLDLRREKGMVLDADDHDTWSAGSFFTNPVLEADVAATLPAEAPRWPERDGRMKVSAAWLIEKSGFAKGYGYDDVRLSTKHTLALTNRGNATTADLLTLAGEIRDGVQQAFGVWLTNEPVLLRARDSAVP